MAKWHLILVWVTVMFASPFQLAALYWFPGIDYRVGLAGLLLIVMLILSANHLHVNVKKYIGLLFLFQMTALAVLAFAKGDDLYLVLLVQVFFVFAVFVFIDSFIGVEQFVRSYVVLMLVMALLGAVSFVFVYAGVVDGDRFVRLGDQSDKAFNYYLTVTNARQVVGGHEVIRVAGFFDEPGTFAFFILFGVILARLYREPLWVELTLAAFGLLTFSLAYVVSIVLFYLVAAFDPREGIKSKARLFLVLVLSGLFVVWSVSSIDGVGRVFEVLVADRFERSDDEHEKVVAGDNRSELVSSALRAFKDSPFLGVGDEEYREGGYGANFVSPFAAHGLLGGLVVYIIPLIMLYHVLRLLLCRKRMALFLAGLVAIIIIQMVHRPYTMGLFNHLVFLMLYLGLLNASRETPQARLSKLRGSVVVSGATSRNPVRFS